VHHLFINIPAIAEWIGNHTTFIMWVLSALVVTPIAFVVRYFIHRRTNKQKALSEQDDLIEKLYSDRIADRNLLDALDLSNRAEKRKVADLEDSFDALKTDFTECKSQLAIFMNKSKP